MNKFKLFPIVLLLCIIACGGKPKQVLDVQKEEQQLKSLDNNASEMLGDAIIPKPGIKYQESRVVDPQHPPVVLNLATSMESNDLDLADFYSQVEFVKLKHPLHEQGIAFLKQTNFQIEFGEGEAGGGGLESNVFLSKDKIVAGDHFFGYHCFDYSGAFNHTIVAAEEFPQYTVKTDKLHLVWKPTSTRIQIFSMMDDNCLVFRRNDKATRFDFHNLNSQKNYLTRYGSYIDTMQQSNMSDIFAMIRNKGSLMLVSPDTYMEHTRNAADTKRKPFMYTFDSKGDTLCWFMNYNPLVKPRKADWTDPESNDTYYYNSVLTIRQAYNDTIYRVTKNRLSPAFILELGNKKVDIETALYGNKAGKIFISNLFETDDFLFIIHTENYDCPNTRNNRSVKFFYSYYHKKSKTLYRIPEVAYPNGFALKNSIPGSIPIWIEEIKIYKNKLYTSYTKKQLKMMMATESFSTFSQAQQAKMQAMYDSLSEFELLVMILK